MGDNLDVVEDQPKVSPGSIYTGCLVKIHGLKAAPHLNGQQARVRKKVAGSDRWEIIVIGLVGTDEVKAVRPDNITVVAKIAVEKSQADAKSASKDKDQNEEDEVEGDAMEE